MSEIKSEILDVINILRNLEQQENIKNFGALVKEEHENDVSLSSSPIEGSPKITNYEMHEVGLCSMHSSTLFILINTIVIKVVTIFFFFHVYIFPVQQRR